MQYLRLYYKKHLLLGNLINVAEKIDILNCQPLENSIYYCSEYDLVQYSETQIANVFPSLAWEHLKDDPSSIFIYDGCRESVNVPWLTLQLRYLTNRLNIRPEQIYVILSDELHTIPLTTMLAKFDMEAVNVDFYNYWLYSVEIVSNTKSLNKVESTIILNQKSQQEKSLTAGTSIYTRTRKKTNALRFSLLSRRYDDHRLLLFIDLVNEGLIGSCLYTFHNIFPYGTNTDIVNSAKSFEYLESVIPGHIQKIETVKKWIRGIPYSIESNELPLNIDNNNLDLLIEQSDVHVVIETYYSWSQGVTWLTEKTYRAISCKKPLIFYTTPFALQDLRKLGFKTYSPIINESYDLITDHNLRRKAIVAEMKRISMLSTTEAKTFIEQCKSISEYNARVFYEKHSVRLEKFKHTGIFK